MGSESRGLQRAFAGFQRQVAAENTVIHKVAGPDTRALDNPLVGGFNTLGRQLGGQFSVAQAPGRQKTAGAGNARISVHGMGKTPTRVKRLARQAPTKVLHAQFGPARGLVN